MFCLTCVWINGWVNNREAGDLTRYRAHYDVTIMCREDAFANAFWAIFYEPATSLQQSEDVMCFQNVTIYKQSRCKRSFFDNVLYCICCWRIHDDVIKSKHFPRHWSCVRGIHRSQVDSPEAWCFLWSVHEDTLSKQSSDWKRHRAHYDVTVMILQPNINRSASCGVFCEFKVCILP